MRRAAMLLFTLWVGVGCVHLPWQKDEAVAISEAPVRKPRLTPPVHAEQITERNAHQKALDLKEEVDRAEENAEEQPVSKKK